jgi:hypothetical protein
MRRGKFAALAVTAAVLLAGCASNAPGDLTASAARTLRPAVEQVRLAAASGRYADLKSAVQQLKNLVHQQEQSGDVTAQRANAIEDAANVLLEDARPTPSPTPSSESPTPTPTTTTASPTPTSESPTPTPTSESPTPSSSSTPIVSVSAVAGSPHAVPTP